TLFKSVKKRQGFKGLFDDQAVDIRFQPNVLTFIVAQMEKYDFLHSSVDVKGMAYETIVGPTLEGTRGEFFTPRNLVKMAVKMLDPKPGDRILDPACGTGGFIVVAFNYIAEKIRLAEKDKWKNPNKPTSEEEQSLNEKIHQAGKNVFGIDFNANLAKTAQMNMIMNNDGRGGIYSVNSLWKPATWPKEVSTEISLASYDMVLTNPPFGTKIKVEGSEILGQYDLAHAWSKEGDRWSMQGAIKTGVPPEILFIERCFQFLKPGTGKMAIVLPDGILGNPELEYVRYWIMANCQVLASVDLPVEMFLPRTGTQTSVLFLRRKSDQEKLAESLSGETPEYSIIMAIAKSVGKDRRGNTTFKRDKEGREIIRRDLYKLYSRSTVVDFPPIVEPSGRIVDDELPEIARLYLERFRDK
ncbi:MAG TPA: N-6 DNA methylase, partial [Alphaproteobacteria bacterium]|nr:N-6 DNA methylase [Alphaproteobacteria bacterium]